MKSQRKVFVGLVIMMMELRRDLNTVKEECSFFGLGRGFYRRTICRRREKIDVVLDFEFERAKQRIEGLY